MGKYSQNFFQADLTLVFADSLNFFCTRIRFCSLSPF